MMKLQTFLKTNSGKIEAAHIANDLAIFGHQALDDNLLKAGVERFGSYGPLQSGLLFLSMIKVTYNLLDEKSNVCSERVALRKAKQTQRS